MANALLIIDAQVDFCHPDGALYVPGADQDIGRMAELIRSRADRIEAIVVTLDTHHLLDIAHPMFWQNANRQPPPPFTTIRLADVLEGRWQPRIAPAAVTEYLNQLEADGQFLHMIWPTHCLIGSRGAALHDTLLEAIRSWAHRHQRDYVAVPKGLYPLSEHFGVFRAQVPNPAIPETMLNTALIDDLRRFDTIYLMGEARSHCVANSLNQLMDFAPDLLPKLVIVTDCMSDVAGLGFLADGIFDEARRRNVTFATSTDILT